MEGMETAATEAAAVRLLELAATGIMVFIKLVVRLQLAAMLAEMVVTLARMQATAMLLVAAEEEEDRGVIKMAAMAKKGV